LISGQMTQHERIAVVIVNYNGGEMLSECLRSLGRQTLPPSRVLVMDNGSSDGSIEKALHVLPHTEFHLQGENIGFARANNLAVAKATDCAWIALVNPDAFPDTMWLERLIEAAASHPDFQAFSSCMVTADNPQIIDGAGDAYRPDGVAWPRFQGIVLPVGSDRTEEVFSACAGASLYRRSAFLDAGGFDEKYFCYHEDVDLGFRLRLRGFRCLYVRGAVVRHVGSAFTGQGSDFSIYHAHRNMVWTYVKNMPSPDLWFNLPSHIAVNLISICLFISRGKGRVILRAKMDAISELPSVLLDRKRIQACRIVPNARLLGVMERKKGIFTMIRRMAERLGVK